MGEENVRTTSENKISTGNEKMVEHLNIAQGVLTQARISFFFLLKEKWKLNVRKV